MRLSREKVLDGAFAILDRYGLGDLTMRRLAGELGVQAGGLYWHFANKQSLLAAMAERIAAGTSRSDAARATAAEADWDPERDWSSDLRTISTDFHSALLAHRDGAELVAAGNALHPGSGEPLESMIKLLERAGLDPTICRAAGGALLHFVVGHAAERQAHDQLRQLGGLPDDHQVDAGAERDTAFEIGLSIFIDGVAARLP